MTATITGSIAILCYLGGAILQYFSIVRRDNSRQRYVLGTGLAAILFHAISFNGTLVSAGGVNLGLFNALSLIGWLIAFLALVSCVKKPIQNLFIGIYPVAAVSILLGYLFSGEDGGSVQLNAQITVHVLLSMLAYSILTVAALQAALLALQDHHLHRHQPSGFVMQLPPLQIMEQLLFELIWAGILLLTLSIASGIFFIEDMFAQHLAHKTILSIIAWLLFSTLLLGRHLLGWRSNTAIRWTLGGYLLLMLAFVGSKLVLEIILTRA